jgi:hypothetical protein
MSLEQAIWLFAAGDVGTSRYLAIIVQEIII